MEISSGVKPEVELLFSVALALAEHISVKNVWITTEIPQEFKIYLIMGRPL